MRRVLLLGAGGPAANGVARSLRLARGYWLHGANTSSDDLLHADVDERHLFWTNSTKPEFDQQRDDELLDLVAKIRPDLVHAQPDEEVAKVSRLRNELRDLGCRVFLPRKEVVALCQDKWRTYQALYKWVPVPRSCTPNDLYALEADRVHVRPKTGAGGKGSFSGTKREVREFLDADGQRRLNYMCAEWLPGPTVTWQGLYANGELICSQLRRRLAWTNVDRGSCRIGETFSNQATHDIATDTVFQIDLFPHGIYGVDMTLAEDGQPRVTEINIGRFFTTIEFFARLGLNMPDLYCRLACGEEVECPGVNPLPDGRRWIRQYDCEPILA